MSNANDADLLRIAGDARLFLTPYWADWHRGWGPPHPETTSQWTCIRSSLFLTRVLIHQGFAAELQSGQPCKPGDRFGYRSRRGWTGHAWVTVGRSLVDITADQFGSSCVIVTARDDPAYRGGDSLETQLIPSSSAASAISALFRQWRICTETGAGHNKLSNFQTISGNPAD
ncbi:hypothetical protein BZU93_25455 [Salmonella enterica subsp. enterica]|nr:hypothetical protein [Salmonella enterica subsp. enterica serovar Enteritidis]